MRSSIFCLLFFCALVAHADTARVIATGDSITCMYWTFLPQASNNLGVTVNVPDPNYDHAGSICTARAGLPTSAYLGMPGLITPPINYANNVSAANPDVILFMLGINDLGWYSAFLNENLDTYKTNINTIFDGFANITNSSSLHPKVVVGSILPFNVPVEEADISKKAGFPVKHDFDVISTINAWNAELKKLALDKGFLYLDTFTTIQQVPNWDTTLIGIDGLHPSGAGNVWLANQYAQATDLFTQANAKVIYDVKVSDLTVDNLQVSATLTADSITATSLTIGATAVAIPEPSILILFGTGLLGLFAWRKASVK